MVNQEIKENRLKNKKGWHLGNKLYYIWEHNQKELLTFLSKYSVNIYKYLSCARHQVRC